MKINPKNKIIPETFLNFDKPYEYEYYGNNESLKYKIRKLNFKENLFVFSSKEYASFISYTKSIFNDGIIKIYNSSIKLNPFEYISSLSLLEDGVVSDYVQSSVKLSNKKINVKEIKTALNENYGILSITIKNESKIKKNKVITTKSSLLVNYPTNVIPLNEKLFEINKDSRIYLLANKIYELIYMLKCRQVENSYIEIIAQIKLYLEWLDEEYILHIQEYSDDLNKECAHILTRK